MNRFDLSLWEKRLQEEYAAREEKRKQVLSEAAAALRVYFASKKVDKVFLTGSILHEGAFYDFSDIDVAVEGLRENHFRTLAELEDVLNRTVDLIELEEVRFADKIRLSGLRVI